MRFWRIGGWILTRLDQTGLNFAVHSRWKIVWMSFWETFSEIVWFFARFLNEFSVNWYVGNLTWFFSSGSEFTWTMGVMSRRVVPVCGNLCFFCPSLRARSRQPVKRYKKLLSDIFPRSQVIRAYISWYVHNVMECYWILLFGSDITLTSQFSDNADSLFLNSCADFMRNIEVLPIQLLIPVRSFSTELKYEFISSVGHYWVNCFWDVVHKAHNVSLLALNGPKFKFHSNYYHFGYCGLLSQDPFSEVINIHGLLFCLCFFKSLGGF